MKFSELDDMMKRIDEPKEKPAPAFCGACGAAAEFKWVGYGGGYWLAYHNGQRSQCPTQCNQCREKATIANIRQTRAEQAGRVYRDWVESIPPSINNPRISDFSAETSGLLRNWAVARAGYQWCLTLIGKSGRGKTHAAFAVARECCHNDACAGGKVILPVFRTLDELIDESREAARSGQECPIARMKSYEGILIIDEVTGERITEFALEKLYSIVYHRDMYRLPTIITTNLELDEIATKLNSRIASRLAGSYPVKMAGEDFRTKRRV